MVGIAVCAKQDGCKAGKILFCDDDVGACVCEELVGIA